MVGMQDTVEAPMTLEKVSKMLGHHVELQYTIGRILQGNLLIIGVFAIIVMLRNFFREILLHKIVWYTGTALVFIFCIGGTAYNLIHGVPTFKMAQDQNTGVVYVDEYF